MTRSREKFWVYVPVTIGCLYFAAFALWFGVGALHSWIGTVPGIGYVESVAVITAIYGLCLSAAWIREVNRW